jgi:CheY-like chemotaxis protein
MPHTILVVDDDAAALSGLVELLNGAGYRTVGAGSFQRRPACSQRSSRIC